MQESIQYFCIICLHFIKQKKEHVKLSLQSFRMIRRYHQNLQKHYYFSLFWKYFVWIVFILEIFLLTNLFSSLSLINAYGIPIFDVFLTYGFLGFLFLIEAIISALLLAFLQIAIERIFSVNLSPILIGLFLVILIIEWINLFLTVFNRALI